jgi:hypothetical protein
MGMRWRHFAVRRKEVWKTTWSFRVGLLILLCVVFVPTRAFWFERIGWSLVHVDTPMTADIIVVENYNQDYTAFETAARLMREGYAELVLIPVGIFNNPDTPGVVTRGFVDVMARRADLDNAEALPVRVHEPVTWNTALQVADRLEELQITSVIVVAGRFRSRRTFEIYRRVLEPRGITLACVPAESQRNPHNWWKTAHGVEQVVLEYLKLQYYRWRVF